jgi:signal transduction histidine kinase
MDRATFESRGPWIVGIAAAVAFVAAIPLGFAAGAIEAADLVFVVPLLPAVGLYVWIGATIASRARNAIGWIFLLIVAFFALGLLAGGYSMLALVRFPGTLPFGVAAAWVDRWALVAGLSPFILVFLLFPTGDVPSRGWRWLLWTLLSLMVVEVVAFAVTPGRLTGAEGDLTSIRVANPLGIAALRGIITPATLAVGMALLAGAFLSVVAVVVRYRRAGAEERQQIRWLAYVGGAAAACVVAGFATDPGDSGSNSPLALVNGVLFFTIFVLVVLGIPIASGIAILKYHLYELDIVVRKTIVATVLVIVIAGITTVILLGAGQVALWRGTARGVSVVIAIVVGMAFGPLVRLARRTADRIVYGKRATPYEVLTDFSQRMAEAYSSDEVLPRMASVVAAGTGAEHVAIWLVVDGALRPAASWPAGRAGPTDGRVEDRFEVRHHGELLGAIGLSMSPSDPINSVKERVVRDLASQAGLVLRNVRLIEELRASRQRLVAAQDDERRKLERNLHDGAQQHLVALAVQLRLAEQMVGRDGDAEREILHQLQSNANEALEGLRDLARGIYPPLLADKGLAAALEGHARRSPVPVAIDADGVGRYPQPVESALYFCSLEALNNVAKYAHATRATIRLRQDDAVVRVEIADDGIGFDSATMREGTGLRGMADRLDAVGGRLDVRSVPNGGTTVVASVAMRGRS